MARVSGNVIGNLSGRLGNLSARTVDGHTILSARPSSFNGNQSPEAIAIRERFAVTGKFASIIQDIPDLMSIWQTVKLPGMSTFNTIFKRNFSLSSTLKPTNQNIITPGGFTLPLTSANLSAGSLALELPVLNTSLELSAEEVNLVIFALVIYSNPTDPENQYYKIFAHSKSLTAFNFSAVYTGSIVFSASQQSIAQDYQDAAFYLAIATKNAEGKVIKYSVTHNG